MRRSMSRRIVTSILGRVGSFEPINVDMWIRSSTENLPGITGVRCQTRESRSIPTPCSLFRRLLTPVDCATHNFLLKSKGDLVQ